MDARPRQSELRTGFRHHLQDYLRWLAFLLLVTAVVGLFVLYLVQTHLDEQIRVHLESKFQEHYSELLVKIASARRRSQGGIEVRGLWIARPSPQQTPEVLVYIDELLVECDTGLEDLLSSDLQVRQVVVRRMLLRTVHRADGTWGIQDLLPLPKFGDRPPPARIESAIVEIKDETCSPAERWVLRHLDLQVTPRPQKRADGTLANRLHLRGRMASNEVAAAQFGGWLDPESGDWEFAGSLKQLAVRPEHVDRLPACVREQAELLRALRGTADIDFRIHSPREAKQSPVAFASGWFHGGIEDERLPHRLRDVRIVFRCDPMGLHLDRLSARAEDTLIVGNGFRRGWEADSHLGLQLRVERFVLDNALRTNLQGSWRKIWEDFSPAGRINADVQLSFDGQRWRHRLLIDCDNISFAYARFPYRLTNTEGRIRCEDGVVRLENLRAQASRRVVHISGELTPSDAEQEDFPAGWIELSVKEPVPINEPMIAALPEKGRRVIRDLQPHGMVSLWARFERDPGSTRMRKQLQIGLHNCAIRYAKFEYPIHRIDGKLTMQDDHWTLSDLRGVNDSGVLACQGTWQPDGRGGSRLHLEFDARDVPLEDELRDALHPSAQAFWQRLRPRGTVDQLQVNVDYWSLEKRLDVQVSAHKMPAAQNVAGRSITIHPTFLPYQLDHVVGSVRVSGDRIELLNLRGRHGETDIRLDGTVTTGGDEWLASLSNITVDRLQADHELARALPPSIGHAIRKLNIQGALAMDGWMELRGRRGETSPSSSRWRLSFDVENGNLKCGLPLEHLHGGLTLEGQFDGQGLLGRGWIDCDSLMYKGIQITQLQGPFVYDRERIQLGQWAEEDGTKSQRPLRGSTLGGITSATAQVWYENARFELDGTLNDGDLSVISREATSQRHSISGKTFASLRLYGSGSGVHTLRGQGQIRLREADIYELPVMIRLLKILRVQTPNETAFTSSDVAFRLEGDRIYFDRIDFDGDAISLEGRGEMNLDRVLNLTFDTFVGRDDDQPLSLILRPLLKEAGRRLLVTRVTGTLEDPHVERIALPDVNEGFQQVFPSTNLTTRGSRNPAVPPATPAVENRLDSPPNTRSPSTTRSGPRYR